MSGCTCRWAEGEEKGGQTDCQRQPATYDSHANHVGGNGKKMRRWKRTSLTQRSPMVTTDGLEAADYAAPTVNTSSTGPWWLEVREALLVAVGKVLHRGLS